MKSQALRLSKIHRHFIGANRRDITTKRQHIFELIAGVIPYQ